MKIIKDYLELKLFMPFSYLIYGSTGLILVVLVIWLFSRKKNN